MVLSFDAERPAVRFLLVSYMRELKSHLKDKVEVVQVRCCYIGLALSHRVCRSYFAAVTNLLELVVKCNQTLHQRSNLHIVSRYFC